MSDTKYGSGTLNTITIGGTACANSMDVTLPRNATTNTTIQTADGPQVIPDIIQSFGQVSASVPFTTANLLASSGAVPGTVPTHITVSGTIPNNPSGFQNWTATGFFNTEDFGTVKRGTEVYRKVVIDLDSFITWS